jgi:hypothetical protein
MVAQEMWRKGTIKDSLVMQRRSKVFLWSTLGSDGARILGAKDNEVGNDAARYQMPFMDRVSHFVY